MKPRPLPPGRKRNRSPRHGAAGRLAAGLLALAAAAAQANLDIDLPDVDPAAGVNIHLRSPLDSLPYAGFAPVRITVRNEALSTRRWDFEFQSASGFGGGGGTSFRTAIEVAAQSEKTVEVLAPVEPVLGDYAYPRLTIVGRGPGARGQYVWSPGSSAHMPGARTPALAVSDSLGAPIWGLLETRARSEKRNLAASRFEPALMPADPLAWIGWDLVWIGDGEWAAASAAQRQAVLDWVKLGGHLVVVTSGSAPRPAPDLPEKAAANLGGGSVDRIALADLRQKLLDRIWESLTAAPSFTETVANGYVGAWPLRDAVPDIRVRTGPILLFVSLFAIVIGPVNLLVLARRRLHLHLFWTTPALALLASLALGLVIILQDGFGGHGARATFVLLDPDTHQAYTWQEQISRTGVLLDRSFPRPASSFLIDLPLQSSSGNPMENQVPARLENDRWSGDWFASRQVQAQLLAAVQATRARVRVDTAKPDQPTVLSELPTSLAHLLYIDARGTPWQADAVPPGITQPLRRATPEEADRFWRRCADSAGPRIRPLLPARDRAGWFFAEAAEPSEHVLETLPSIRWTQRLLLYHGPASEGGA